MTNHDYLNKHEKRLYSLRLERLLCYGADKHVDPANELSLMRVSKWQPKTMKEQRRGNKYNKWQFIGRSTNVCKVRDGRIWSSDRMLTLIACIVET